MNVHANQKPVKKSDARSCTAGRRQRAAPALLALMVLNRASATDPRFP